MNNYVSTLDLVDYSDYRFSEKEHKVVNKLLPHILKSDIFDEFKYPNQTQINFQYYVDSVKYRHYNMNNAMFNVYDWDGSVIYMEYVYPSDKVAECTTIQWSHITPHPSLLSFKIEGFSESLKSRIIVDDFESDFDCKILPDMVYNNYGFKRGTPIYKLIENKVKDEIKNIIHINMQNRYSQIESEFNRPIQQRWETYNGIRDI
jgi:hypothetical protein